MITARFYLKYCMDWVEWFQRKRLILRSPFLDKLGIRLYYLLSSFSNMHNTKIPTWVKHEEHKTMTNDINVLVTDHKFAGYEYIY